MGSDSDRRPAASDPVRVHDGPPFNQKRRTMWTQPLLSFVGRRGPCDTTLTAAAAAGMVRSSARAAGSEIGR
jgi:tRNA U34 5-methylaminomethyl-2-thiouridine-forming methyltransferase MnmC